MRNFGTLRGANQDHAVLLLKIGGLTVADWNFDGTCRIWETGDPRAPALYGHGERSPYFAPDLRSECRFSTRHHPQNTWQATVARHIGQHTNIWISSQAYMPSAQDGRA
jgi:hypothetical protein